MACISLVSKSLLLPWKKEAKPDAVRVRAAPSTLAIVFPPYVWPFYSPGRRSGDLIADGREIPFPTSSYCSASARLPGSGARERVRRLTYRRIKPPRASIGFFTPLSPWSRPYPRTKVNRFCDREDRLPDRIDLIRDNDDHLPDKVDSIQDRVDRSRDKNKTVVSRQNESSPRQRRPSPRQR